MTRFLLPSFLFFSLALPPGHAAEKILNSRYDLVDADSKGFLFTSGRTLWYYSHAKKKRSLITKLKGANENARLSPDGKWVGFAAEDPKAGWHKAIVWDVARKKEIYRTKSFRSLNFLFWRNECTLMVGTGEKLPNRFYIHRPSRKCRTAQPHRPFVFSQPAYGTWLLEASLLKPQKLDWNRNIYDVRGTQRMLTGAYADGGVFVFDVLQKTRYSVSKGYRPTINSAGDLVVYQTPEQEIYLWDFRRKKEQKISQGSAPHFISERTILYTGKDAIYEMDLKGLL